MSIRFLLLLCLASSMLLTQPDYAFAQKKKKQETATSTSSSKRLQAWELDSLITPIPIGRRLFTDKVEKIIDEIDARDGSQDGFINYRNEATSRHFTQAFMADAPKIIILTENLDIPHNEKVKYHKILEDKLLAIQSMDWDPVAPAYFSEVLQNLRQLLVAQYKEEVVTFATKNTNLTSLQNMRLLEQNGVKVAEGDEAKAVLYKGLAKEHPLTVLERLYEIKDQPYTDTIVSDIAQVMPGTIMEYAAAEGPLSAIIKRNADPFVQTIVRIVDGAKKPQQLLPFLGPIHREEVRIAQIDQLVDNDNKYFQGLVNLVVRNETVCRKDIDQEVKRRILNYAHDINNESLPAERRFSSIEDLRDIDYYLLAIEGRDVLKSSSLAEGIYPLMIRSMGKKSGKELMAQFNNYRFRTFTRIWAENELLDAFLRTMSPSEKDELYKAFTNNLELGDIKNLKSVEPALEVMNAFPYLNNEDFSDIVRSDADFHYSRIKENKGDTYNKGILAYGIMRLLFFPEKDKQIEDILGLENISQVPYEDFLNSLNEVTEQVYFTPDADGKKYYAAFMRGIKGNSAWDVEEHKHWIKITSNSAKKVVIYANVITNDSLSKESLQQLKAHMNEQNINPVIVFHCAPGEFLSHTISATHAATRVLLAGHSFGDENLMEAIGRHPKLHIIASRKTSTPEVDVAVFNELNKQLLYGRNLSWKDMWKDLNSYFVNTAPEDKAVFDLMVRPDEHMGLLFLKTYIQALQKNNILE